MNRFSLLAALTALSVMIALLAWRFEKAGLRETPGTATSVVGDGTRKTDALVGFGEDDRDRRVSELGDRPYAPQGRFAENRVLDRSIDFTDPMGVVVLYMLQGEDPRIPIVFLEERYRFSSDGSEPVLAFQSAAKGDEIIFDADPEKLDPSRFESFVEEHDWTISWKSRLSAYVQVKIANPTIASFEGAIEALSKEFPNTTVSADHLHFTSAMPSEYSAPVLWHLEQVNAPGAWGFASGSDDVVVAVIDTGCSIGHEDLEASVFVNTGEIAGNGIDDDQNGFIDDVSGWDFYDNDAIPEDETGHGTHVSGILGARGDNGIGVAGVSWNTRILPLKVGDSSGLSSSAIAEALRYVSSLKDRGILLVATNNSYGSSSENAAALEVIQDHEDKGILFVAAAGNTGNDLDGSGASQYPAAFTESNIIAVANSTQGDRLSVESSYGSTSVDIAAPGQEVYSTYNDGGYRFLTGTSMSSPMVAGAIALVASHEPGLDSNGIKARILDTAKRFDALEGKLVSGGRLDVLAALKPGMMGHGIDVPSHPAHLTLLPDMKIPVVFELEALADADVSIEVMTGASNVHIEELEPRSYSLSFTAEGVYRFRLISRKESVVRAVEKVVVVGASPDVKGGLLHSWDMEGMGNALIDSAGSGDGELVGATRVDTPMGKGVDFDGTDSFVSFESSFSTQVTLSAFVKSDDLLSSSHPRIMDAPDYYLYFSTRGIADVPDGNANALKFYSNRSQDFGVWHSPPDTIFEGEWVHVLASYDSQDISKAPSLYINGEKQRVRTQRLPVGAQSMDGGPAFLGDREDGSRAWDGQMDEVRVYSRIVSDDEVSRLSARYLGAVWDDFEIRPSSPIEIGQSIGLSLVDSIGGVAQVDYEWSVTSELGAIELTQADQAEAIVTFGQADNARFILKASTASLTRYYYYDVLFDPVDIQAGVYVGQTEGGGVAWVEVDEALDRGYVTLLDAVSGFRRLREPISIDLWGRFATSEALSQRILGKIDNGFIGNVEGLGLAFSGNGIQPQSVAAGFSGFYSGGLLGEGGELLDMLVLENGELFVWLNGRETDLGQGNVDLSGRFDLITAFGNRFVGAIDLENQEATGSWTSEGDEAVAYMRAVQAEGVNRYVNLSTRGYSQSGERILIGGFVLSGPSRRTVLIRGVGPSLAERGVTDVLEDPFIALYRGQEVIARNDRWGASEKAAEIVAFSEKVGAEPFGDDSLDAAMLVDLDPGLYTVMVGSEKSEGEALFEVFDDVGASERALRNVSSRGRVRGTERVLIGGLVVAGEDPKLVLIRGAGPALAQQDIFEPLADPRIELYLGDAPIASNDDWMDGSLPFVEGASLQGPAKPLKAAFEASGAFAFDSESKDAAMLVWVDPGLYTVILSGGDGTEGIALVEVYEID